MELNSSTFGNDSDDYHLDDSTVVGLGVFFLVCVALIIVSGLIGNSFCISMFSGSSFRKRSSSQYLLGLALADIGFLLSLFVVWLNELGISWYHQHVVLILTNYTSSLCSSLSSWIIVAFTMERFLVVQFPLKCKVICSPNRARAVLMSISVLAAIFNIWVPMDIGRIHYNFNYNYTTHGGISEEYHLTLDTMSDMSDIYDVMVILDTALSLALPAVLIFIFDILIGLHLIHASRRRLTITSNSVVEGRQRRSRLPCCCEETGNQPTYEFSIGPDLTVRKATLLCEQTELIDTRWHRTDSIGVPLLQGSKFRRISHMLCSTASRIRMDMSDNITKEQKITRTLVCIATFYLVANIPSYIVRLLSKWDHSDNFRVAQTLSFMLSYTQFSANFYLYSLTGHKVVPKFLARLRSA